MAENVNYRPIRQNVGVWSTSTWERIINHLWVWVGHSHTHWKLFWLLNANPTTNLTEIWNEVSSNWMNIINHMFVSVGVVWSLPHPLDIICLPKTDYGPIELKFGIWSPSSRMGIKTVCMCVCVCVCVCV